MKWARFRLFYVFIPALLLWGNGCSWLSKKTLDDADLQDREQTRLVGDLCDPLNMKSVPVEGFALVTGLRGTGCNEGASPERSAVLRDMQTRGVRSPHSLLASTNTAVVRVRGFLRPGIQELDRFDVEVALPPGSEATSLAGGWMMRTALKEMAVLSHQIRQGHTWGFAEGPIMVDPLADLENDPIQIKRGRVLGGGIAVKSRPLFLMMKPAHRNPYLSARIDKVINERFQVFENGINKNAATAKTDTKIEIRLHPTYKDNVARYMQVLQSIALYENEVERNKRVERLSKELLVPRKSRSSALQLEALGKQGIEPLRNGLESENQEVQFYSAEALAYLNHIDAAETLTEIAREEAAFRVFALNALGTMKNDFEAAGCLRSLLNENSAETRYGAFRALWHRNPHDPAILGEYLNEDSPFSYHVLETSGPPMVHATKNHRPELVLFSRDIELKPPFVLDAGNRIMVQCKDGYEVIVSRFSSGNDDQKRTVTTSLDEIIRAVAELGGTYPDVVRMLQEASKQKTLTCRFEIDALPEAGRVYKRPRSGDKEPEEEPEQEKKSFWRQWNPFAKNENEKEKENHRQDEEKEEASDEDSEKNA